MSGRVQKESADDSDRIDDAVDPRVQVRSAVLLCIVCPDVTNRERNLARNTASRDIDISPSRGLIVRVRESRENA